MTANSGRIARSYLYVPGHRADLVKKALWTEAADAIVIDLEDAVPEPSRRAAREVVAHIVSEPGPRPVWVRVNPVSSGLTFDDVAAAAGPHLTGIRLAKTESAAEVGQVAEWLRHTGCRAGMSCLLESALALERAYEIAASHPAVCGIALGEADLTADLGVSVDEALLYARSRCVAAASAAGLAPPVQSVFTDVRDDNGLRLSCEHGRALGFIGRSAVHPRQLETINSVYSPSAKALVQARSVIAQWDLAEARAGAILTDDGRFLDPAVVKNARRTIALAELMELHL